MNNTPQNRTRRTLSFAMILISLASVSQGLQAQNIYKCGNSYSQTPCPGASPLSIDDTRTAAQKQQADAATRSNTELAQSLEKTRIAQEKMAAAQSPAAQPVAAPTAPQHTSKVVSKITPKRIKSKKYKPDAFIALVPGSDKKSVKKKSTRKKTAPPA